MPPPPATGLRLATAALYALFCALGAGLLGKPALFALTGFGWTQPVLPARVPLAGLFVFLLALLVVLSFRLAYTMATGKRGVLAERGFLLITVGASLALRASVAEPAPPLDPTATLVEALRSVAHTLDEQYASQKSYRPDPATLAAPLLPLGPAGFVLRGRALPLSVTLVDSGPQPRIAPVPSGMPGTIVVALSPDRTRALLWVLTLDQGRTAPLLGDQGRPVVIAARAGTHGSPGKDALLPDYPGWEPMDKRLH